MTVKEWLTLNWKIGALSFGGGGRAIYYQEALVEKSKQLTEDEFNEAATITQVVPGPNLVNLGMYLGLRLVGLQQMLWGFLLLCVPGVVVAVVFYHSLDFKNPLIALLFKGFSLGSVTFFIVFVYRLSKGLKTVTSQNLSRTKMGLRILLTAAIAAASIMGLPLFWVLAVSLPTAIALEFST